MKKVIYILVLAVISTMSLSGCTEQEVKPTNNGGAGGSGQDPKG